MSSSSSYTGCTMVMAGSGRQGAGMVELFSSCMGGGGQHVGGGGNRGAGVLITIWAVVGP